MGVDRILLCLLDLAYSEEKVKDEERVYLKLVPGMAPVPVAVFPLTTKDGLDKKAREISNIIEKKYETFYDEAGSIGKRYRRMDELGTPVCVTIDYQTLEDNTVTVRERDSMKQMRIKAEELPDFIEKFFEGSIGFI